MTDANTKLDTFIKENQKQINEGKFIDLFVQKAGSTLGLARDLFEESPAPSVFSCDFEKLLYTTFINWSFKKSIKTRYNYLSYYWENSNQFVIPGYITEKTEVDDNYIAIVASNLKATWFKSGEFEYQNKLQHGLVWNNLFRTKLEYFYDQQNIKERYWQELLSKLESFDNSASYKNFLIGIQKIKSHISEWGIKPSNYLEHLKKWKAEFSDTLPFPINRFNILAETNKSVQANLEQLKYDLRESQSLVSRSTEVLSDFIQKQKDILLKSPVDYTTARIAHLKKLNPENPQSLTSLKKFEDNIKYRTAAAFIAEHEEELAMNKNKIIITNESVTAADLAIIGQAMVTHGLFKEPTNAYKFLSANFSIRKERTTIYYSPTPNHLLSKIWPKIHEHTKALKKHRSFRNRIDKQKPS